MRMLVGKRQRPNPDLKAMLGLVQIMTSGGMRGNTRTLSGNCEKCGADVSVKLTEDTDTGEIWLTGPDTCSACGNQLADPDASPATLSQSTIREIFGPA